MRALIQRVTRATVTVGDEVVGGIGAGILAFVGVTHDDSEEQARKLADKIWNLRIFDDGEGVMNLSVADTSQAVLVVSQFTLYGETGKGRRPGYSNAASPDVAGPLVGVVMDELGLLGATVATGRFGAEMEVELVNDGPVTLYVET